MITRDGKLIAGGWGGNPNRAFTWDGTMRDLGIANGYVVGLTDFGAVAGNYSPDPATTATRPFTLSGTVLRELGGFEGGVAAVALGINGRGTVIGYATPANGPSRAVAWTGPQPTDLGSLEIGWLGWSTAYGINASGVIVGESAAHGGSTAVVFRGNGVIEELGTLGGQFGRALAINDAGVIVGAAEFDASRVSHGFFYAAGKMTEVRPLPGYAYLQLGAVNSAGVATGVMWPLAGGLSHGIVATPERVVDLNGLVDNTAAEFNGAGQIDDKGDIVTSGAGHAVLLVPIR